MIKKLSPEEKEKIEPLIARFIDTKQQEGLAIFQKSLLVAITESSQLMGFVHSIKHRVKKADSLRDKLRRKMREAAEENKPFVISPDNLFTVVNDLAGIRILHLHTKQVKSIDEHLKAIIADQKLGLLEGPFARTWDDEYRDLFKKFGFETQPSKRMYTSVHYVVSDRNALFTCEIQVRTLMEEVWGEVDHTINYPHKIESVPCTEQILALARSTSAATRLVDSIFETVADMKRRKVRASKKKKAEGDA